MDCYDCRITLSPNQLLSHIEEFHAGPPHDPGSEMKLSCFQCAFTVKLDLARLMVNHCAATDHDPLRVKLLWNAYIQAEVRRVRELLGRAVRIQKNERQDVSETFTVKSSSYTEPYPQAIKNPSLSSGSTDSGTGRPRLPGFIGPEHALLGKKKERTQALPGDTDSSDDTDESTGSEEDAPRIKNPRLSKSLGLSIKREGIGSESEQPTEEMEKTGICSLKHRNKRRAVNKELEKWAPKSNQLHPAQLSIDKRPTSIGQGSSIRTYREIGKQFPLKQAMAEGDETEDYDELQRQFLEVRSQEELEEESGVPRKITCEECSTVVKYEGNPASAIRHATKSHDRDLLPLICTNCDYRGYQPSCFKYHSRQDKYRELGCNGNFERTKPVNLHLRLKVLLTRVFPTVEWSAKLLLGPKILRDSEISDLGEVESKKLERKLSKMKTCQLCLREIIVAANNAAIAHVFVHVPHMCPFLCLACSKVFQHISTARNHLKYKMASDLMCTESTIKERKNSINVTGFREKAKECFPNMEWESVIPKGSSFRGVEENSTDETKPEKKCIKAVHRRLRRS